MPQPCGICGADMTTDTVLVCKSPHKNEPPKVGSAVQSCPLVRGGIWVRVSDESGRGVEGVPVSHPGQGAATPTDGSGYSAFDPLDEGSNYAVTIGPLPKALENKYFLPKVIQAKNIPVTTGQITSVEFSLERACKLQVTVHQTDDASAFIEGFDVTVTGPSSDAPVEPAKKTTPGGGTVTWEPLRSSAGYQIKISPPESKANAFQIDGPDTKSWDLHPDKENKVAFTVSPLTWVKFVVADKDADAISDAELRKAAQPSATVKLKQLDETSAEKPAKSAEAAEYIMTMRAGKKCAVEELTIEHSGPPDAEPVWFVEDFTPQ